MGTGSSERQTSCRAAPSPVRRHPAGRPPGSSAVVAGSPADRAEPAVFWCAWIDPGEPASAASNTAATTPVRRTRNKVLLLLVGIRPRRPVGPEALPRPTRTEEGAGGLPRAAGLSRPQL